MDNLIEALVFLTRAKKPKNRTSLLQQYLKKTKENQYMQRSSVQETVIENMHKSVVLERIFRDIRKMLISKPDLEYYHLLADVCKANLDLSSEIQYMRYAVSAHPTDKPLKQRLSALLAKHGQELMTIATRNHDDLSSYTNAISQFTEASLLDKENARIFAFKAICHIKLGEFKKALETMDKAIAFSTDIHTTSHVVDLFILRAKLLQSEGMLERCMTDMKTATALNPEHPEVIEFNCRTIMMTEMYYKNGMNAFNENEYDKAIRFFKEVGVV
jgi:tetratricopeptide (TPR) repeat protein